MLFRQPQICNNFIQQIHVKFCGSQGVGGTGERNFGAPDGPLPRERISLCRETHYKFACINFFTRRVHIHTLRHMQSSRKFLHKNGNFVHAIR